MNIAEELFLRTDPRSTALIEKGISFTYEDLNRESRKIGLELSRRFSDHKCPLIGLQCRDGMAYIAVALGILRAGACLVAVAPELSAAEREVLISTLALDFIVAADGKISEGIRFSLEKVKSQEVRNSRDALQQMNPAFIRFSSGTTGAAKGIVLSHKSLHQRIEAANKALQISSDDRILWVLSMSHHFVVSVMLYLWNGAALILPESHLPGDMLAAANGHRATVFYAAPCHYIFLTSGKETLTWPSLRLAVSTTARLPVEAGAKFASLFGIPPAQALGMMEVGLPFVNQDPARKPDSVGTPQPGFELELRDHAGIKALAGESGELFLKGPGMFDAYMAPWQTREDATRPDGWFGTGDIAAVDEEGFLILLGRTKSLINVGGMKFFPEEIESVLCSHSGVKEARVLGVTHSIFGMVPLAEVVALSHHPEISERELTLLCRKHLARYKVPVEIRFVESIPRTPTGKIRRS